MVVRHCNSEDVNLTDESGFRGNCGRSFDDNVRQLDCPHKPFPGILADKLAQHDDLEIVMRYRFAVEKGWVVIECGPCGGQEHAKVHYPSWAYVRGPLDVNAFIEYHEANTSHRKREVIKPDEPSPVDIMGCLVAHPVNGMCIAEKRNHEPRTHFNGYGDAWTDEQAAIAWHQHYRHSQALPEPVAEPVKVQWLPADEPKRPGSPFENADTAIFAAIRDDYADCGMSPTEEMIMAWNEHNDHASGGGEDGTERAHE